MSQNPVNLHASLPETVLAEVSPELSSSLIAAMDAEDPKVEVANVVRQDPTYLDGWARLSDLTRDALERYAYARVGYHRGLDALRKAGWRGSGYVRWRNEANRGFLRCLSRLAKTARTLGEDTEAERCELFLRQLDPDWTSVDDR